MPGAEDPALAHCWLLGAKWRPPSFPPIRPALCVPARLAALPAAGQGWDEMGRDGTERDAALPCPLTEATFSPEGAAGP